MKVRLLDLVRSAAERAVSRQRADGSFPPGHNGPYGDRETPVRNTAHWLVTLCHLERRLPGEGWGEAADRAVDYLLGEPARPGRASFLCRSEARKDRCNGLMGQAWAIEGLVAAADTLQRHDARETAREVFSLHTFVEPRAVWRRVEVDGRQLSPDATFNHQLWFAAVGGLLGDAEADRRAALCLERVVSNVQLYRSGIVYHKSRIGRPGADACRSVSGAVREGRSALARMRARRRLRGRSVGYHAFNLYAIALLKQRFPDHGFWSSRRMGRMLRVTRTASFERALRRSEYGYPYNPPGLELAFAGEAFDLGEGYVRAWLDRQAAVTYDSDAHDLLRRGASDEATCSARIYEATRLAGEYTIEVPTHDGAIPTHGF